MCVTICDISTRGKPYTLVVPVHGTVWAIIHASSQPDRRHEADLLSVSNSGGSEPYELLTEPSDNNLGMCRPHRKAYMREVGVELSKSVSSV
jgi:hypothetical protein